MPQSESTVEASVELVAAKPKRKPRFRVPDHKSVASDEIAELPESLATDLPKVRRARRTKAVSAVVQPPTEQAKKTYLGGEQIAATSTKQRVAAPVESGIEPPLSAPLSTAMTPVEMSATQSVHPETARLSRVVGVGRYAPLPLLGDAAVLGLRLMHNTAPGAVPDPYCALVLNLPGGLIELGDGVRLLAALTGIDLGLSAVELPHTQWLHAAVIGRLGQTPLRDVIAITRGCLPPEQAPSQALLQDVHLTLHSQQHAFSIQARARTSTWLDFLTRTAWHREQLPIEVFTDLPIRLPVLIGTHTLPQAMVNSIDAGDVLIIDTAAFDCDGNGRLRWRGMQLRVGFNLPASLTILNLEPSMEQCDDAEFANDEVLVHSVPTRSDLIEEGALDGLPVQLQFEMGHRHTTLAALRTLAPGTVLPIEGGSPAAITILVNGRQLGRGEVVDVNGQLGIRIVFWAH